jgi:nucleoid-associated protein YgaU
MNDPAVRVALTISIFLGCLFIAIVFRPILSMSGGAASGMGAPLSVEHQRQGSPTSVSEEPVNSRATGEQRSSPSMQVPTVLLPLGASQGGPSAPPRWQGGAPANSARWGMPIDMMPAAARPADGPQTHKIVDGDTLEDLAARYLGSALRSAEIFQANRDLLSDPRLLPIGAELKIPGR